MATKLDISDLADVLAALGDITKPYQLGIQLKLDLAELDTIEKNYPRDIDRQKTEVIKYWLRNSPDVSWATLANALQRLGGHARLIRTLRDRDRQYSFAEYIPRNVSPEVFLEACEERHILISGKMKHGKSTVGNRILNYDSSFAINNLKYPLTDKGLSALKSVSQCKDYKISVYDHNGLFEGASSIDSLPSEFSGNLDLAIFVFKRGYRFDENEQKILEAVTSKWKISQISALVLTHCERLSEEERQIVIEQFKKDNPSVAKLMGKGILAVGFPDSSHVQPGSQLSQKVADDKAKLRRLIYSCHDTVTIPEPSQTTPPSCQSEDSHPAVKFQVQDNFDEVESVLVTSTENITISQADDSLIMDPPTSQDPEAETVCEL